MQSVILGTAQWGLDYGVTNVEGRLSDEAILALAAVAQEHGIQRLDTAPGYGDAEARIGALTPGFGVQTKVSANGTRAGQIRASVNSSLATLGRTALDGVLVHDWSSLGDGACRRVAGELEELRGEGLVTAVGISGYVEADVASALEAFETLDVVQVPVSVLDQRLDGSRVLTEVRDRGGRIQARSILLQGAAVAPVEHGVFGAHPDVVRLRALGDPLSLCLGFVRALTWVDELVLAVTSVVELEQLMQVLEEPQAGVNWPALASSDTWLIDPRQWTAPTREG